MDPSQAAKELLEKLGDGLHVLRTHSPSYIKFRRDREDMREIFVAFVLLTEGLRKGVQNTELQGWYPELREGPQQGMHKDDFFLGLSEGGNFFKFYLTPDGIRYSYRDGELVPITRMVGESVAEAAVRLVFQALEPVYAPSLFSGSNSV
jgi:hypothetical protein